jgi:hypothetical protein
MTLSQLLDITKDHHVTLPPGAVTVTLHSSVKLYSDYWHLSDYTVSSRSGPVLVLLPRNLPDPICLACNKPLSQHRRITAEDVAASQGATFHNPRNGFLAPLPPKTIGSWVSHDPVTNGRTTPF